MSAVFALLAAACWGSSDFAAGHASRRASAKSVVVLTHLVAALVLVAVSVDLGSGGLSWRGDVGSADVAWGLGAGIGGALGAYFLFRGLGRAPMALVAPITAAGAAALPALVGLATGERPGALALLGIGLALAAVVLISRAGAESEDAAPAAAASISSGESAAPTVGAGHVALRGLATATRPVSHARSSLTPGVVDGMLGGGGFALFFICIARVGPDAGFAPLAVARLVSVAMFVVVLVRAREAVLPPPTTRGVVALAGLLDAAAAASFMVAVRIGLLSVGSVLASLYPAATILLARAVAGERLHRQQAGGLILAAAAVSLLAL